MCFDFLWNCGFFTIAIDPSLSPSIKVGRSELKSSSLYEFLSHVAFQVASERATYLASVNDNATVVCFLELHVIAPPLAMKT